METILDQPSLPVRRLHNFIYCPRLFYYQWVENIFQESADTVEGSRIHEKVDAPSRMEPGELDLPEGKKVRSLRMESEQLGIIGVVDIVEGGEAGAEVIDYKKGSARRDDSGQRIPKEADAVQVVAQALLLREQGLTVSAGWVYYAADRRRVPVVLNEETYESCRTAILSAKAVAASGVCPPSLVHDARCLHCSAYPICLPNESRSWAHPGEKIIQPEIAPRPDRDDGEVLVVHTPGAKVGKRGGEITVSLDGKVVKKLPAEQVRAIYLFGAVQLSAQAVEACLECQMDVSYFSPAGRFLGLLRGLPASGVDARRGQYRLFDEPGIRLQLAREVIRAKIHNQRVLLMRNGEPSQQTLAQMAAMRDSVDRVESMTELMGVEGTAAALYFSALPTMLKGGEAWRFDFTGRNRRPPRDPVNALLSLGYSMLVFRRRNDRSFKRLSVSSGWCNLG